MLCPFCNHTEDGIIDGQQSRDRSVIRRRRECTKCHRRYTTMERIENLERLLLKRDGRREQYMREKVMASIVRVCEKRPLSMEQVYGLVADVEIFVRAFKERSTADLAAFIMERLKELDGVAYTRYAAGHVKFQDVSTLDKYVDSVARTLSRSVTRLEDYTTEELRRREEEAALPS